MRYTLHKPLNEALQISAASPRIIERSERMLFVSGVSEGRAIPWPATRVKQPGAEQHCYTRIRLGQASLSIPLSPIGLAFLGAFGILVFGCMTILHVARGRTQRNHVQMRV